MKIKIDGQILESRTIKTLQCPAGTAYWRIEYLLGGEVLYACSSAPMHGEPSPLDALSWYRECGKEHRTNREWLALALLQVEK